MEKSKTEDTDNYYAFYERVAILLENNPDMTEDQANKQAAEEIRARQRNVQKEKEKM